MGSDSHDRTRSSSRLCHDASFVSGAIIPVDGALTANMAIPRLDD
jgi:hypothetical protein